MIRVKTFVSPLAVFHAHEELEGLDAQVNRFLKEKGVRELISVSDACTSDERGASMGIIRVVAYREP